MTIEGLGRSEIAAALGISETMVTYTQKSKIVKEKLHAMEAELDEEAKDVAFQIRRYAKLAIHKMAELMVDGSKEETQRLAARDILKMDGRFEDRSAANGQRLSTPEDIEEIKKRAMMAGQIEIADAQIMEEGYGD